MNGGGISIRVGWTDDEWDDFLSARTEATYFHSRAWARLVCTAFPKVRDQSLWFEEDGESVLVPLYAWRRARGVLTTLDSSFPFLYGGPVPCLKRSGEPWKERILPLLREGWASVRMTGNPFCPSPAPGSEARMELSAGDLTAKGPERPEILESDFEGPAGFQVFPDFTHRLLLPESEQEYWERGLTSAQRNDVRRLTKKGVLIEESRAPDDVERIHQLYVDSFARWGGRPPFPHPVEFYHSLATLGGEAVRFTVARYEGKVIGGAFTVRWNRIAHYLAGYYDFEARALRPNVLLQIESIRRAIQDRFVWYDFLPSGPGHDTVAAFKEGLGGQRTPVPVFEFRSPPHRFLVWARSLRQRKRGPTI